MNGALQIHGQLQVILRDPLASYIILCSCMYVSIMDIWYVDAIFPCKCYYVYEVDSMYSSQYIDNENTSTYNDGNATHDINAIFKSTVILPCHLKLNHSKPTWLQHKLALDSKV